MYDIYLKINYNFSDVWKTKGQLSNLDQEITNDMVISDVNVDSLDAAMLHAVDILNNIRTRSFERTSFNDCEIKIVRCRMVEPDPDAVNIGS